LAKCIVFQKYHEKQEKNRQIPTLAQFQSLLEIITLKKGALVIKKPSISRVCQEASAISHE